MKPEAQGLAGPRNEKERIIDEVFGSSIVILTPAAEPANDLNSEPCIHPDAIDASERKRLERALAGFEEHNLSDTHVLHELQRALTLAFHASCDEGAECDLHQPEFDLIDELEESLVIAPLPKAIEPVDLLAETVKPRKTAAAPGRARETNFYVYSTEYKPDLDQIRAWLDHASRRAAPATGVNLRLLEAFGAPRAIVVRQIDRAGRERIIGVSIVAPAESGLEAGLVGPLVTAKGINVDLRSRALQLAARDHLGNCHERGPTYFLSRKGSRADTLTLKAFGAQKAKLSDETDPRHELMRRWLSDGATTADMVRLLLPARTPSRSYQRLIEHLLGQCQAFNYWTDHDKGDDNVFHLASAERTLAACVKKPVLDLCVKRELRQFYQYSHRLFDTNHVSNEKSEERRVYHMLYHALAYDSLMFDDPRFISPETFYTDVLDEDDEDDQSDAVWTQSKLGELNSAYSAWTTSVGDQASNGGRSLCFGFANGKDDVKLPRVVAALGSEGARLSA